MKSLTAWLNKMSLLAISEQKVMRLASEGYTNRQIGERLEITEGTVKVEMSHVYKKLGLTGNKSGRYHLIIALQHAASSPVLQM